MGALGSAKTTGHFLFQLDHAQARDESLVAAVDKLKDVRDIFLNVAIPSEKMALQ